MNGIELDATTAKLLETISQVARVEEIKGWDLGGR